MAACNHPVVNITEGINTCMVCNQVVDLAAQEAEVATRPYQPDYSRSYGYLYEKLGEYPDVAQIAKAMRADIKEAQKFGLLPTGWKYSVTIQRFSGGQSIDITVKGATDAWQQCTGVDRRGFVCHDPWCAGHNDSPHADVHPRLTEDGEAAKMTLERIHGAYNHDGSDSQVDYFDVRYYGTVNFDWQDRPIFAKASA